jgi:hypothetical protein
VEQFWKGPNAILTQILPVADCAAEAYRIWNRARSQDIYSGCDRGDEIESDGQRKKSAVQEDRRRYAAHFEDFSIIQSRYPLAWSEAGCFASKMR